MPETLPPDSAPTSATRRYRLHATRTPTPGLRVIDTFRNAALADWRGAVAERLLSSDLLPASLSAGRDCYACKGLVQRLAMLAASEGMKPSRHSVGCKQSETQPRRSVDYPFCPLEHRLRRLDVCLNREQRRVAELLFKHAGDHLSLSEVTCLLNLDHAPVTNDFVCVLLAELAEKQVIQILSISDGPTFYDVDTRPHLHIYDRASNTLKDACVHGVVEASAIPKASFLSDASVSIQARS